MVIVEVDNNEQTISVIKNANGLYDVVANDVVRHPDCDAESAMRALGNYLQSAMWNLESCQKQLLEAANTDPKKDWHRWFCWYPVCSIEYGWVWLRYVSRKRIPKDYVDNAKNKSASHLFSEKLTTCWHRIPDTIL